MTLLELLKVISKDDYVGIWNIDDRKSNHPTKQHYAKVSNLSFGSISNLLDYDVLGINHNEKGYLIRVYRGKKEVDKSLFQWELVDKYFHRLDQRNGVK